jgi:3-deoxy-D-manno-octulosonate 8-phosphate phosphatase (KDO 8-P phosphatase)
MNFKAILEKAKNIRLLVLDVDGVLTDGKIYFNEQGIETKSFYVPDGVGIKMLLSSGVEIALISGRNSAATKIRAKELGIKHLYLGNEKKPAVYQQLKKKLKLDDQQIAYLGDDLPDLVIMQQVALSIAVRNAHPLVIAASHHVTNANGGEGAVREVCELILSAQHNFEKQKEYYA